MIDFLINLALWALIGLGIILSVLWIATDHLFLATLDWFVRKVLKALGKEEALRKWEKNERIPRFRKRAKTEFEHRTQILLLVIISASAIVMLSVYYSYVLAPTK